MLDDDDLLRALRDGDEAAFTGLVRSWRRPMLSVALAHVPGTAVAEEVVQDTWLAVVRGLDRFEGRSSLRTWVFAILENQARTRGVRERRSVPISALAGPDGDLELDRLERRTGASAEDEAVRRDDGRRLVAAIDGLPARQRTVLALRDLGGWPAREAAAALGVTAQNQRVLLHRARAGLRRAVGDDLVPGSAGPA